MNRAANIALLTRRFRLLASRPDLAVADRELLIERMLDMQTPLSELDRTLVLYASELDRFCAHSVRILRERTSTALLDVLGVLDHDRVAAIYFSLPPERRVVTLKDPTWGWVMGKLPPGMEDAIATVLEMADNTPASERARNGANVRELSVERAKAEDHQRRAMRMESGLPVKLTKAERPAGVTAILSTGARFAPVGA